MVLFPLALNTAQAWVQDTHLKAGGHGAARHGRSGSRGAPPGALEAVREEPSSRERTSEDGGAASAEQGKAAAEQGGAEAGDDHEALLSPYRGDS